MELPDHEHYKWPRKRLWNHLQDVLSRAKMKDEIDGGKDNLILKPYSTLNQPKYLRAEIT